MSIQVFHYTIFHSYAVQCEKVQIFMSTSHMVQGSDFMHAVRGLVNFPYFYKLLGFCCVSVIAWGEEHPHHVLANLRCSCHAFCRGCNN